MTYHKRDWRVRRLKRDPSASQVMDIQEAPAMLHAVQDERRAFLERREAAERVRAERKAKGLDVRHLDPATVAVRPLPEKDPTERTYVTHTFRRRT